MIIETYYLHILILILIYAILAISFNVQLGYGRLFNLSHIALFGIGAYTSALLTVDAGMPFIVGFILGGLVAAFFGMLIAIPALQLRGDYFAIATLGFAEIIRIITHNERWLTHGQFGISGIARPEIMGVSFASYELFVVLTFILLIITYAVMEKLIRSPFGRVLKGIRENETAVISLGKDIYRFKLQTIIICSFFAGLAGSLYAHYVQYISPKDFTMTPLLAILVMVVLGGIGNNRGSILGAAIFMVIPELLRFSGLPSGIYAPVRQIIVGLMLVLLMLARPQGIIGEVKYVHASEAEIDA
ncbi:MAG: branched-chain amino acid ABC transporter permease [Methanosarcinaceae archaeon]